MRNLRFVIAYQGTAYAGWQIQPQVPTVQGVIEEKLRQITQRPCRLRAAGRTDAGVHARGQVANFRTEAPLASHALYRGLNALLPEDIAVLSVEEVPFEFDTRRHNRGKHYRYSIWNERTPTPEKAVTTYHLHRALDLGAMSLAARLLVGTHDFASFRSASCEQESTVRTLYRCTVSCEGGLIQIDVEGTAFLQNMVRIIVGTLLEVGQGRRTPDAIRELLAARDRKRAGVTVPAHGLCLMKVFL
jgi:tRNA pseudouridine38-40 synthase